MLRTIIVCVLFFISTSAFCQKTNNSNSILSKGLGKDSTRQDDFYFTLDEKSKNLIVPSDNNGMKLYGIKIFDAKNEEVISAKIDSSMNPNSIDISKLPDGEYIVHLVTVEQVLYKTKLFIKR